MDEQENATAFMGRSRPPTETFTMRRDDSTTTDTTLASTATLRSALAEQAAQHAASQRAFEARIEALESGTQSRGRNGGKRDTTGRNRGSKGKQDRPMVCRQYKFYCSTHGVNLSHDTRNCRDKGPNHNDNATYDNKMGGCTRGDKWWMLYRDTDHQLCKECPQP